MSRRGAIAAASGAVAEVEELFPGYSVDGAYELDLVNDDPNFVLTNMERGVDPLDGEPAVFLTTVGSFGSIRTVASHPNVNLQVKVRPVARGPFATVNLYAALFARAVDAANEWRLQRSWSDGNSYLQSLSLTANSQSIAALATGLDNTDDITERWLSLDMFEDEMIGGKEWEDGDAEPDWIAGPKRLRAVSGIATTSDDSDSTQDGTAGFRCIYGFMVKGFRVKPLARTSVDVMDNLDLAFLKAANQPFFFERASARDDATNGAYIDDVEWGDGVTRRSFVFKKDNDTEDSPTFGQTFYLDNPGANVYFTREHPRPAVTAFPSALRIRVAVEAVNARNTSLGNQLTIEGVAYYNAANGGLLMNTEGHLDDYHFHMGPNNGSGTFGRTIVTYDLPINSRASVVQLRFTLGLHDATAMADHIYAQILDVVPVP